MPLIFLGPEEGASLGSASTPKASASPAVHGCPSSGAVSGTGSSTIINQQCQLAINAIAFDYYLLSSAIDFKKRGFIDVKGDHSTPKPVIRIYGSLSSGQKACVNVHGMLPYLYFRPLDPLVTLFDDRDSLREHLTRFHKQIENYLEFKRVKDAEKMCQDQGREYTRQSRMHIHSMDIVSTKSIYGYHAADANFIKVTYLNPADLNGILHMLEGGFLGRVVMQAYESHIPYMLKFIMDHNVQPMGWVYVSDMRFRQPLPASVHEAFLPPPVLLDGGGAARSAGSGHGHRAAEASFLSPTSFPLESHFFTQGTTPIDKLWSVDEVVLDAGVRNDRAAPDDWAAAKASPLTCQCTSGLELDIHVDHILNSAIRPLKFGDELWEEERRRRELRRLPEDRVPTQPSTQTCHLDLGYEGRLFKAHLDVMERRGRLVERASLSLSQASGGEAHRGELNDSLESSSSSSSMLQRSQSPVDRKRSCSDDQGLHLHQDSAEEQALFDWLQMTQHAAAECLRVGKERLPAASSEEAGIDEGSLHIIYASQQDDAGVHQLAQDDEASSSDEDEGGVDERAAAREREDILSSQGDGEAKVGGSKRKSALASSGSSKRAEPAEALFGSDAAAADSRFSPGSRSCFALSQLSAASSSEGGARKFTQTGDGSSVLRPSFDPPLPSHVAGQSFTVNPPLHFSDPKDYLLAFGGGAGAVSRGFLQRRHERDCHVAIGAFHDGDALAAAIAGGRGSKAVHSSRASKSGGGKATATATAAAATSGDRYCSGDESCLAPTFAPPDPHGESVASFAPAQNIGVAASRQKSQVDQIRTISPTAAPRAGLKHAMDNGELAAGDTFKARVTIMSIEILSFSSGEEVSNPAKDPVLVVAWAVDDSMSSAEEECVRREQGIIYVRDERYHGGAERLQMALKAQPSLGPSATPRADIVSSEQELLLATAQLVRACDPDILLGYEVQNSSLGYLTQRARVLNIDLLAEMSRFPHEPSHKPSELDKYSEENLCDIFVVGRLVLNGWRLLRKEMKVYSYFQSNAAQELLGQTVPQYSSEQLNRWFRQPLTCCRPATHTLRLALLNLDFLEKLDLVRRTAESARLYGIDFISVLTRGSQFRVEAALTRKAHLVGFVTASPTKLLVANQAAIQAIPLVAEPRSGFYSDPVIVLDFTSLYPSIIIAHNLCYSTIMGKLHPSTADPRRDSTTGRLGALDYPESTACAAVYAHSCVPGVRPFVSPNGAVFCDKKVRLGVLPQMLKEVLDTRQMIKRSMKAYTGEGDALLRRSLDARQLAIKLLSNVTYGYAAASFSGRMPMAELADAIVSTGKATLEDAMSFITSNDKWKAEVVYSDTDSLFVLLRGRSKDEALRVGQEMALAVTQRCLSGVDLKFEKVYFPCILVTKKRYCGSAWEHLGQQQAHFEAKGVECIRSDQCPATAKLQERALRLLFESRDISAVKKFLARQWAKMLKGGDSINVRDFIFYKNVKTGHYKPGATLPPAAELVSSLIAQRRMRNPPYKWKMPYVVVYGAGSRLIDLVATPEGLLRRGSGLKVNVEYYLTKCINPALQRVLGLCGAALRVDDWYAAVPKPCARIRRISYENCGAALDSAGVGGGLRRKNQQTLMDKFAYNYSCELCASDASTSLLCAACAAEPSSLLLLQRRLGSLESAEQTLRRLCDSCAGFPQRSMLLEKGQLIGPDTCAAISCPVFFERCRVVVRLEDAVEALNATSAMTW